MQKKRIAIDMDEVVADALWKFEQLIERDYGKIFDRKAFSGGKIYDMFPDGQRDKVRGYLFDKGFFIDLPVMENSQEVIRELSENFEIFFTTAAMEFRHSLEDKYDWLLQNFPFVPWKNFVFCGDKSIIRADYMIDDHVHNLETFQGKGLLYTASHNINERRFTRVNNWLEIRAFFREECRG